jgi:hypothetical protein
MRDLIREFVLAVPVQQGVLSLDESLGLFGTARGLNGVFGGVGIITAILMIVSESEGLSKALLTTDLDIPK